MTQQRKDWKDQLREVKREMSTPVTELRNEKEITRAVQYTEEELQTHLQLGTADTESKVIILQGLLMIVRNIGLGQTKTELSRGIDELLSAISALDQAVTDLLSGAEAQVKEFSDEIRELQRQLDSLRTISVAEIENELRRREEEKEKITPVMDGLYKERESLENELKIQEQLLKHGVSDNPAATKSKKASLEKKLAALNKTLESVEAIMIQNDQEEAVLVSYRDAVRFVKNGLPEGIIGRKIGITV